MTKERNVLAQLLKSWAQEHNINYVIADPNQGDQGVDATSAFFTWVIKNTDTNINLLDLLNKLEAYVLKINSKQYPDGFFCKSCGNYYPFAGPNQTDGTLICWSCRN